MKENPLDDIIQCDIDISRPATSKETFDTILIIVPKPAEGELEMTKTTAVASADELLDYGFDADDVAYKACQVAFSQDPGPSQIMVCVRQQTEGSTDEDLATTLARAAAEASWYGVHLTSYRTKTDLEAAIAWVEANDKLLGFEYTDIDDGFVITNTNYNRTFAVFAGQADGYGEEEQPAENEYLALAEMAKCFGYDPGTETWAFKTLMTVVPSALSTANKNDLDTKNVGTFQRYSGKNITLGGKTLSGEWIDIIRFRDWLKNEIQIRCFNVFVTNAKVPFTDGGINLIAGAAESALIRGQDIGAIAPTEFDEDGNPTFGYVLNIPLASSFTEAERKSRKLTGLTWTARLTGAIHFVELRGTLYS